MVGDRSGCCPTPTCDKLQDERYQAQQLVNADLYRKYISVSMRLWLIMGGIGFANVLLIVVAAWLSGHAKI